MPLLTSPPQQGTTRVQNDPWAVPGLTVQPPNGPATRSQSKTAAPQSLLSSADAVLKEMSGITGLPIKSPLKKKLANRAEIRRYLTESLHAEYTPREIHQQETMLKAFGLVSREFTLGEFLVSFYTEQAAGVYDQRTKTMLTTD